MSATTIIINDETPRRQYTAAAGQTVFDFPFPFFADGDLEVYLTPNGQQPSDTADIQTIVTDYTVTGADTQNGGQITLTSGATAGDIVTILRVVDIDRTADYQAAGDLLAETLNAEQDTEIMISQQLREEADRAIRSQKSDVTVDMTLPSAADRADGVLTFDTNGSPQATSTASFVAGLSGAILGANYVTNTATGDGSTLVYAVSVAPGSKGNIQIYIDGVYQNKSSFSINSTTITFTEAPPLNASVEFIIGYSIGSTNDAGDITFTQAGTGAQTRTIESKLNEWVSVTDFGATGNGVTDDATAIQAAIDSISNYGEVYVPEGTYIVDSASISITKPLKLILAKGAILKKTTTIGGILKIDDTNNVEVWGGTIQHVRTATGSNTVNIRGCSKVKFSDVQFIDSPKDNVYIGLSLTSPSTLNTEIRFDRCEFLTARRQGCSIVYGDGIYFDNCLFKGVLGDAPEAGVDIESNSVSEQTTHVYFNQCTFEDIVNNAGVVNATGQYVTVTDCKFKDNAYGVYVASVAARTNTINITSVDHTVEEFTATSHGLKVGDIVNFSATGGGTLPTGISSGVAYRIYTTPTANTFTVSTYYNHVPVSISDNGSLPLQALNYRSDGAANTVISGCHIEGSTSAAIYGDVGFDLIASNNTIVGTTGVNASILLNNIDRAIIQNNSIRGSTDGEGIFLSGIYGNIRGNVIVGSNATDEGIRYYGGYASKVENNTLVSCGDNGAGGGTIINIRYFDHGSICNNICVDPLNLNPALGLDLHSSDSTYNIIQGNNFKDSSNSDGGSLYQVDATNVFDETNILDSGAPYVAHYKSTTTKLDDITDTINTVAKWEGKRVFNTSTNVPVYATGSAASDVWVYAAGGTAHTPV